MRKSASITETSKAGIHYKHLEKIKFLNILNISELGDKPGG